MADKYLLALYNNVDAASNAIADLRQMGFSDAQMAVLTGSPYEHEMLGRPRTRSRLGCGALSGAALGVVTAAFLTAGIWLLYPLIQGGQPLIPIPPSLIVFFEVTMLGAMWASFFGLLWLSRLPSDDRKAPYDPRITEGYIGVQVYSDEDRIDDVEKALKHAGSVDVVQAGPATDPLFKRFWGGVAASLVVLTVILGLFVYNILRIDFPSNMVNQDSFAFEQGPRLAAPTNAVPVQGPDLINQRPASQPIPASTDSLQRGKVLFGINCEMCHGATGVGNGVVGAFFTPKPFDLTSSTVQTLTDNQIYLIITQGTGVMPPIYENLSPQDRWDVINYVRTLAK